MKLQPRSCGAFAYPKMGRQVADSVPRRAGIWAVGYGHTSAAYAPMAITDMKISAKEAVSVLRIDLAKFDKHVQSG